MRVINHRPVVTCEEASIERRISLKRELKTLVLKTDCKNIAVHIRGCDTISSKEIKYVFRTKHLRFFTKSELKDQNIAPGLVNPWNVDFCHYHLLCPMVLKNKFIGTNNSRFDQGILFRPDRLFALPNLIIGNFSIYK